MLVRKPFKAQIMEVCEMKGFLPGKKVRFYGLNEDYLKIDSLYFISSDDWENSLPAGVTVMMNCRRKNISVRLFSINERTWEVHYNSYLTKC